MRRRSTSGARSITAIAVVGALALVASCGEDDESSPFTSSTAASTISSTVPVTTTAPTTVPVITTASTLPVTVPTTAATVPVPTTATTTASTVLVIDPAPVESAIWPLPSGESRFADPTDAARSFAVDFLGFGPLIVGEFVQGDSRSGEVAIQAREGGPVSTVLVRQLTDDASWWVIGAATANLQLASPEVLDAIASPVTLSGISTAFEATINVRIFQDGGVEPLANDIAMGGSMGEMGPFSATFSYLMPTSTYGAVVLSSYSSDDGRLEEVSAVRIRFADANAAAGDY